MATKSSVAAVAVTTLLAWGSSATLAGCGQKGPLTLPAAAAAPAAASAAAK
jgi:predicted small lipoprotein YifL